MYADDAAATPSFLTGGGRMAALIAAHDWSGSLGPLESWPQSLKTAVGLMIHSPVPLVLLWGPDGIMLYNQGYAGFAGNRHPSLLGSKVLEGWPEAAELNTRVMQTCMAGSTLQYKDLELTLNRRGQPEPGWMDLFYSPVIDESGRPGGVIAVVVEPTGRGLAERAAIAQRERLAQMFQDAPSFMCQMDGPDHVFSFTNAAYQQLIAHRDVIGKTVHDALPEIAGQGFYELLDQVYASGESYRGYSVPVTLQRTPGAAPERRLLDFIYQPVRDSAGTITGIFTEGYDVTESHRSAGALARSEQRLQLALDAAAMGSFVWHVAQDVAEGDPRMMALFGLPPDGLLTLRTALAESIDPRDAPRYAAAVAKAIDPDGDGMLREDIRVRLPDGTLRWLAIAGQVTFAEGRALQMAGAARDITESRNAEAALRKSEAQFRTMAQAMPNHVWTAAPDGLLEWLNDRTYAYAGAAPGTLLGNEWTAIVHPDDLPAAGALWANARETGGAYEAEFRLRRHDGQWRWHIARALPVKDDGGHASRWVGTNTDIQDHKEVAAALEEFNATLEQRVQERTSQLQQAEEALRQSQKMEAVGQLTGGIAHDFNNLLQGITGALDRVHHRIAEGRTGDVERFLKAAVDSANRAAALTHRLLAFSRRQTLDPRPTDANRLIGGMEELVRRTMGPNVQIEVVGAAGLWPVRVDPSQLENSLLNLCINARDAMPEGGKLTIETANKWLDERAARDRELPPGQYVSLCVTDTGTGMAPDVISRAFDPFFTTKPLGRGTGLGLSMIYGFVRQSGGQVRIYSEIGKGTTMCLYFPRYFGKADEDSDVISEVVERGFGETVLVVDDEATVRMLIAEVLSESFYNIIEAVDGPSALKALESDRRIDLMITDVGLPGGMNGRQVADAARVVRTNLKVLFITGYAENAAVANGHLEPGMEILAKPFAMSTLANKVREMIES